MEPPPRPNLLSAALLNSQVPAGQNTLLRWVWSWIRRTKTLRHTHTHTHTYTHTNTHTQHSTTTAQTSVGSSEGGLVHSPSALPVFVSLPLLNCQVCAHSPTLGGSNAHYVRPLDPPPKQNSATATTNRRQLIRQDKTSLVTHKSD